MDGFSQLYIIQATTIMRAASARAFLTGWSARLEHTT